MKKIIKPAASILLLLPKPALAGIMPPCPENNPACNKSLIDLITTVSNTLLLLVGVIAVLFLIIGGFQYITSSGNPEQVGKAKNTILYAIIGIVVTLIAWAVVSFIISNMQ